MRIISPVPNLATLLAICAIAVGAYMRARGRRPYGWDQFVGALIVVAGTGVNVGLAYLLDRQVGRPPAEALTEGTVLLVWMVAWMTSTLGFIIFAWGYVSEVIEDAGKPAQ